MTAITPFTPVASTIGGMLIGLSAALLMLFNGRIAGISGILARLFPPYRDTDSVSAVAFVAGLMAIATETLLFNLILPAFCDAASVAKYKVRLS